MKKVVATLVVLSFLGVTFASRGGDVLTLNTSTLVTEGAYGGGSVLNIPTLGPRSAYGSGFTKAGGK